LEIHESYEDFINKYGDKRIFLATTHGGTHFDEIAFEEGDFIMFGKESSGVLEDVHNRHNGLRVPMIKSSTRSLNLSNTAAIIAYEALRQIGFPNMK
jgi:tRNA (cytidine/uridine-2'-O-)-methyltransferase